MSEFYEGLQGKASRLLTERGRSMVLRRRVSGAYDPATGSAPVTVSDSACAGATFPFPALLIDGTRIQVGDLKVLLAVQGLTFEPAIGDELLIGGAAHQIKSVQPIGPDGTVVIYRLQVRR